MISDWAETVCLHTECQTLPQDGPIMCGRRWLLGGPGRGGLCGSPGVIATPSYTKKWFE